MSFDNICCDFMEHRCKRENCPFIHDKKLCYHFWKHGHCKWGNECRKNHFPTESLNNPVPQRSKPRRMKNTENFTPSYEPADMRVLVEFGKQKSDSKLQTQDVLFVPDFFQNSGDTYQKLVDEVKACGDVFVPWHENSHFIANDKLGFKNKCPIYLSVIEKIRNYFGMKIEATRFNWYSTDDEWKPFHHDRSALYSDTANKQNFTVGVSFGKTRQAGFEEVESKKVIAFPLPDGSCYCFARDINTKYKHGILPVKPSERTGQGRVSVIAWGWVDQDDA